MTLAIVFLCVGVLLAVFFTGQYRGRKIEAAFMADVLRLRGYVGGEVGRAYATVANDLRTCEAKVFARIKQFL